MADIYPGNDFFKNVQVGLLKILSITYNSEIHFLPYDLKIVENLTPEWNQESVIGRMDPIARFKRMGRTMTIIFKARAKENLNDGTAYLPYDDLLHCVDHLKRVCYPRYDLNQVMTSPPLFRIKHDLIQAGENTNESGVLCYITAIKADPVMEKNSVFYKTDGDSNNKIGNLTQGIYPKAFDITIGITVLNEQLVADENNKAIVTGTLNKRYFYVFSTGNGPAGGHTAFHAPEEGSEAAAGTTANSTGTDGRTDAAVDAVTSGGQ
jgi:hypothetical protein